jgi:hypothetical protein
MADQKEETRREREEERREIARVDSKVGRLWALAIIALAAVVSLLLIFGDRSDSPRVVKDGAPASKPGEGASGPAPTTPAPPATPKPR